MSISISGTFDTSDAEAAEAWGKLWPESLSGSGAGNKTNALLRVLPVVESLVRSLLLDLSWTRRKQGVQVTPLLFIYITLAVDPLLLSIYVLLPDDPSLVHICTPTS